MNDTHASMLGYDETTPVLIVGGSLVGLSTSLFLSWHGIPSLLVERHAGISPHPRAFNFNMRTMELFRSVGVEEAVRKAEPPGFRNSSVLQAESLAGKELRWISQDTTGSTLSPVQGSITGQDLMEPILRARAEELGGDLRFQTECVSFEQDATGVSAVIRDRTSGKERTVRARYLVAADGNHSTIRQQLGIEVDGPGVQGHQLSLLFSANIQEALRGRRIAICFVNNPTIQGGTLILARGEGRGYGLYAHYHPEKGEREDEFVGERGIALVRGAIGMPDLPVEISNVRPWEVAAWTAACFQHERVFLVGDAAHVTPPAGAFGANTGIADASNLAWKLALTLQGLAHPTLLATYSTERQPVARHTVEQSFAMFARFAAPTVQRPPVAAVDYASVAFGYRYPVAPLPDADWYEDPYQPSGQPGTHAAHVVLQRHGQDGQPCSTLDLFGQHCVLLTGAKGATWQQAAQRLAERRLPLAVYRIGEQGDFDDVEGRFLHAYGLSATGAVLVRPDGFIAWQAASSVAYPEPVLEHALASLLGYHLPQYRTSQSFTHSMENPATSRGDRLSTC